MSNKMITIEVSDVELAMIKMALRQRMSGLEDIMRYIRGEYRNEHKKHYEELKALYYRIGGST